MLQANDIAWTYNGKTWLFQHKTVAIERGEVVGIYGFSGSGKTSFGKILARHMKPSEGTVTLDGVPLPMSGRSPVQLIFQHPEQAINPRWKMRRVLLESGPIDRDIFEAFGLQDHWLDRYPHELSGGELQRFAIVRALHPEVSYIVADEMTTMLDSVTQQAIWRAFFRIARMRQMGMLIISHDFALLECLCDRVLDFETMKPL